MNAPSFLAGSGALVTGGTSGLGASAAKALADAGAQVVVVGRNAAAGERVAAALTPVGHFASADVSDEAQVAAAVDLAANAANGLRVAVSAAGNAIVEKTVGQSGPHSLSTFRGVLDVNLIGSFNVLRLAAAKMSENLPDADGSRGVIILTSSIGGIEGSMGQVAYAAAKGAIISMILPAARDLARSGIRVVGIAPGVFDTPFMDVLSDEVRAAVAGSVPYPRRLGFPEEYASLVLEITRNPMLNGDTIRLDGALRLGLR